MDRSVIYLFLLTLIGQYYSLILPGQIAGELVKAYKIGKGKKDAEKMAASVIIDRLTGLIGLMCVAILGLSCSSSDLLKNLVPWFWGGAIFFSAALYLFQFPLFDWLIQQILFFIKTSFSRTERIVNQCFRLTEAWKQYLKTPSALLKCFFIGIALHLTSVSIYMVIAAPLDINLPFSEWCWIFSAISVIVFLPVTVGGVGLREGGFVFLLGEFGVSGEKALALSLSLFALRIIGALAGGIIDFMIRDKKNSAEKAPLGD